MVRPLFVLAALAASAPALVAAPLTIETLLDIKHPSRAVFSPDGSAVAFVWDRAGVQDVYVAGSGEGEPRPLTRHEAGLVDGLFWSRDGRTLFFERGGDLWQVPATGGEAKAVWTTPDPESGVAPSHDGTRVAFVRNRHIWMRNLADGGEMQLTN